jgi:subtilisin family serine protease
MAIGATTNTDVRWPSSCFGAELDIVAPGANIFGLWRNSGYTTSGFPGLQSGTSMATPHVSGLAALLMSYNPALSVPQIEQIIKDSVDDIGVPGWEPELGWGRLNMRAALEAATAPCEGDANGSGTVDVDDLLAVITGWGICQAPPAACPPDVFPPGSPPGNGVVDVDDLLSVITHWGVCP